MIEIGAGILEAGVVVARHRVSAKEGEAVLLCQREGGGAHHALGAAAIDHHGVGADVGRHFAQIGDGSLGEDGDQHQIAGGDVLLRQRTADRAADLGIFQRAAIRIRSQNSVTCLGIRLGKGSADETQAYDSDGHNALASRTRRTFSASAA